MTHEKMINELIDKEVLEKSKEKKYKNIHLVIGGLFTAIPNNKFVLMKIEKEFENNFKKNKAITELQKNKLQKTLKQEWFQYWSENKVEPEQEEYFNKYFPKYSAKQQNIVLKNTDENYKISIEQKGINPLTQAIKNFKNNNVKDLEVWAESLTKVNNTESQRIFNLLSQNKIPKGGLSVLTNIIKKFNLSGRCDTDDIVILSENPNDFKPLIKQLIVNESEGWRKGSSQNEIASVVISNLLNMNVSGKRFFINEMLMIFSSIYEKNLEPQKIQNILKNLNFVLDLPEIKANVDKMKSYTLNQESTGLKIFIDIINEPSQTSKNILSTYGFDGKTDDSSKMIKFINANYLYLNLMESEQLENNNINKIIKKI